MSALAGRTDFDDVAAMGFQNPFDDAQAEAEAAGAGGKKRSEDARLDVGRDTGTAVQKFDLKVDTTAGKLGESMGLHGIGATGADRQRTAVRLKRQRVFDQLGKSAFKAGRIREDRRQVWIQIQGQRDWAALRKALIDTLPDEVVQIVLGEGDLRGADKVTELLKDLLQPKDASPDAFRPTCDTRPVYLRVRKGGIRVH